MSQNTPCSDHSNHSYGWGSADVDSGVSACTFMEHQTSGAVEFGGCGTGVARACYYSNCNDQSVMSDLVAYVEQTSSGNHLIYGRAKA